MSYKPRVSRKEVGAVVSVVPVCPARRPDNGLPGSVLGRMAPVHAGGHWGGPASSAGGALAVKGQSYWPPGHTARWDEAGRWSWPSLGG